MTTNQILLYVIFNQINNSDIIIKINLIASKHTPLNCNYLNYDHCRHLNVILHIYYYYSYYS